MSDEKPPLPERLRAAPHPLRALFRLYRKRIISAVVLLFHLAGALTSVEAIMETRTPQGAVAWALSLNLFPYGAVPLYWAFGHTQLDTYVVARRSDAEKFQPVGEELRRSLDEGNLRAEVDTPMGRAFAGLSGMSFTRGNTAELLVDGGPAFESMFEAIDAAESYILVQFYIVRDDDLGRKLKDKLIAKARQGVRIYFLYDEIGSLRLGDAYKRDLADAGVEVAPFSTNRRDGRKYQINFRNHRKILVVDGKVGFTGGLNVGDEYLGHHERLTPWRDTHIRVTGPVVQQLQISFGEDWYWARGVVLNELDWTAERSHEGGDLHAFCLATGPADPLDTCALLFLTLINSAQERLWIATPYFVPDGQIVSALQLAALRGVDVRLLLPENPDHKLVYYSSFSYLPELERVGIKLYRYQEGFMHQKVVLVDEDIATVGSANFDNRSFRLNFEITIAAKDAEFASEVAAMLEGDFAASRLATAADFAKKSFFFRLKSRIARLLAPVQ